MFVPVACSQCGKPFQVPEASVGNSTVCPWCQATVLALPVGAPASGAAPQSTAEPLPLDATPRRTGRRVAFIGLIVVLTVAATLTTFGLLRYKQGHTLFSEWRPFQASDHSCRIDLLGRPVEAGEADEKRYVSEGWYSGTKAWIGWRDLTPVQVQQASTKDSWLSLLPLFTAEQDRLKTTFGGTVTKEATLQFENPLIREVRLESPEVRVIERMIVKPQGANPRLYFVGMAGKNLDFDSDAVKRLFESFTVLD